MNIVMIHPQDLYSLLEPWTVRIKKISSEFLAKGHCVKLFYFPLDHRNAYAVKMDSGIEVISLDRRLGLFVFLKNLIWLNRRLRWCHIVHFQKCYHYVSLLALIAARINNKPLHYDWDDWETKIFYYSNPRAKMVGGFIDLLETYLPALVDTVSVSSERLRQLCVARGRPPECVFHAPVGADLNEFMPQQGHKGLIRIKYDINHFFVLYVGQLHGGQYAELFIKAARIVIDIRKDVTFMIVGDGYRLQELKTMAEDFNLRKEVIFTGGVSHDEIPQYIADADVCVACFEDNDITQCKSPLKIAEYLAMGKAIVCSNVGEARKMVGGAGLMVAAGDKTALADGILRLLDDRNLRQTLSSHSRYKSEKKYNWSMTANTLLEAYRKAAHHK